MSTVVFVFKRVHWQWLKHHKGYWRGRIFWCHGRTANIGSWYRGTSQDRAMRYITQNSFCVKIQIHQHELERCDRQRSLHPREEATMNSDMAEPAHATSMRNSVEGSSKIKANVINRATLVKEHPPLAHSRRFVMTECSCSVDNWVLCRVRLKILTNFCYDWDDSCQHNVHLHFYKFVLHVHFAKMKGERMSRMNKRWSKKGAENSSE